MQITAIMNETYRNLIPFLLLLVSFILSYHTFFFYIY
jgi:hypothetical protein